MVDSVDGVCGGFSISVVNGLWTANSTSTRIVGFRHECTDVALVPPSHSRLQA